MAELSESLRKRIIERPDLWRKVCLLSLELLEGTDEHVDKVLALYRNPASTNAQFSGAARAANAAYYAAYYAANAANAAYTAAYAANAAACAAYAAADAAACAANAAACAANAIVAVKGDKVERFIAELELLVRFAPQQTHDREEGDQPEND